MLTEQSINDLAAFTARMSEQWERVQGLIPGLQFIRSGERGSQVMLVCSAGDFCEGVIIGQLEHIAFKMVGSGARAARRRMTNAEKPLEKKHIELTDAQIDKVIDCWRRGESAARLPFVIATVDRTGKVNVK